MCDGEALVAPVGRRRLLGLGLGAAALVVARPTTAAASPARATGPSSPGAGPTATPTIAPRSAWADGVADAVGLAQEQPGAVKVLLVHHTETGNAYGEGDVARQIRSFHDYHTSSKGWPDVAYNFFVDRFGGIWEGRTGSLAGPVIGDATGGNQGATQLCCFIGGHTSEPPTAAAQDAMVSLLAWLADRYDVDPSPGATATFTSRGSNRWPAGASVTSATIEGHRAMSQTTCPGDAAYPLVTDVFPAAVAALVGGAVAATTTTTAPPTTTPATTTTAAPATTSTSTTGPPSTTAAPTATSPSTTSAPAPAAADDDGGGDGGPSPAVVGGVAGGAVVVAAAAVAVARGRTGRG